MMHPGGEIRYCPVKLNLNDRTFGASLEQHITGDRVDAGIPAVSQKLLCLGEASQCHNDRAKRVKSRFGIPLGIA